MTENSFDILSLKDWGILRYLKIGHKSLAGTVIKIYAVHPEIQNFHDEGETNYEINKENMNEFCTSTALLQSTNRKIQNKKQNTTIKPGKTFVDRRMSREK